MTCEIIRTMNWMDWSSLILIYVLGTWKMFELVKKVGNWAKDITKGE